MDTFRSIHSTATQVQHQDSVVDPATYVALDSQVWLGHLAVFQIKIEWKIFHRWLEKFTTFLAKLHVFHTCQTYCYMCAHSQCLILRVKTLWNILVKYLENMSHYHKNSIDLYFLPQIQIFLTNQVFFFISRLWVRKQNRLVLREKLQRSVL